VTNMEDMFFDTQSFDPKYAPWYNDE